MYRCAALLTALVLLSPTPAGAAKVKVWHHCLPAHYDKAQIRGAVVSNEGALRLSRQLKPLADLDAEHVWDIVQDKTGNLYVATGDDGRLFKVAPDGQATMVYQSTDSQILCLALAPDGSVYAGTGPGGRILHVAADGQVNVLFKSPESYVWCLALDTAKKTLYAGTGPRGRVYKVPFEGNKGKAGVFYQTKQEHILSLAMGPDHTLYAGTDKHGLVYRFDAKGKGFVLYHAPQTEIRTLLVGPDGVYAGTSAPQRRAGSGSQADASRPSKPELSTSLASRTPLGEKTAAEPIGKPAEAPSHDNKEKGHAVATAAPPAAGENSLYRIGADGSVREVFREKAMILSLLRQHGRIFVGTGMEGQLFEIDEATRERSQVARLDHGEIHCMCRRQDGTIVLGAGDPGKLYVLQDRYTHKGTVVSDVLDAKLISQWGALDWKAETPAGTRVSVAVRSGNLAEPDETWSDWSAEQTDPEHAAVAAPTARFLQYRITLSTTDPAVSPTVRSIALRYRTRNQAPDVTSIEVPDLDAAVLENPKKLRFKWTAVDPNEDELTYSLYVRKEGWTNWVRLEENLSKREYEWDTTTTPSGIYRLKVVASDRPDNAPADALTGERISLPFAVAHTPPVVAVKYAGMEGDRAVLEATATDELVRLTAASFALNGQKWVNVFPTDGLFDRKTGTFRFTTAALKPGTYVVVLRVHDAEGNVGSGDVVFTVPTAAAAK
jgi:hypothetical protein